MAPYPHFKLPPFKYPPFKYPLKEFLQLGFVMSAGDILAQYMEDKEHDWMRTAKFTSVGLFFLGPPLRYWYDFLQLNVQKGTRIAVALKKMALDQFIYNPIFSIGVMAVFGLTHYETYERFIQRFTHDYPHIMKHNIIIWPPIMMFNFFFLPPRGQLLFTQTVAIAWNSFISKVINREKPHE